MKEKVITEFGQSLSDALNSKNNDINCYVWRAKDGKEVRLMDMSESELQNVYDHSNSMIYNSSKYTPGKLQVKKNIRMLINQCNAELFKRYLLHECNIDLLKTPIDIVQYLRDFKKANNLTEDDSVSSIFNHLPKEFEPVTIGMLLSACLDQLEVINRRMITDGFILAQGIWLTDAEKEELTEADEEGNIRPWRDVIKERLFLPDVKLRVDPKGFTYSEFRSIMHLSPISKISSLPTDTLRLMRDKVFILLDSDVDYYIDKWGTIIKQIEEVAKYKKIELTKKSF